MKTSVSLAALMLMAACSAAASPNVAAAPSVAPAMVRPEVAAPAAPLAQPVHASRAGDRIRVSAPAARAVAVNPPVSCDVRAQPTANGVRIQALARADRGFDGEYQLVITKSGRDGNADVTSGGPVSVAAGEAVTLSSTELGVDGRFRAVLTLSDASGEVCRQELRS